MTPLVSIIIPTFNRSTFLGKSLDSIIVQTYSNWECLIIDDGSLDYTPQLVQFYTERDSRFHYYDRPAKFPKGANACRNYGLSLSKGKYINWFDSDDTMQPTKIEKQVAKLESNQNLDLCIATYNLCDSQMNILREMKVEPGDSILLDYLTEKTFFNFQSSLFRKHTLTIVTDEYLHKAQEMEFFIRYLQQPEIKYQVLAEPIVDIRLHEDNITSGFNKGVYNAIKSEMQVRLTALKLICKTGSSENIKDALQLYSRFLKLLLKQYKFGLYFKYVLKLFFIIPTWYFFWGFKAIFLGLIFIIFRREPYKFRNILKFNS